MSFYEDAERLEALLPAAINALFQSRHQDPLRHHSISQVRLMRALSRSSRSASELGQMLNLSPSSLTQMAGRLIRAGLVSKALDPHDRRVRMLSLTPAGQELMDDRRAMRAQTAVSVLQRLDPGDIRMLMRILTEIAEPGAQPNVTYTEAVV